MTSLFLCSENDSLQIKSKCHFLRTNHVRYAQLVQNGSNKSSLSKYLTLFFMAVLFNTHVDIRALELGSIFLQFVFRQVQ